LLVILLLPAGLSFNSSAEIPHENYDLANPNLNFLIALLSSSVVYSEAALSSMHAENMSYVEQNLSIVRGVLTPANQLLQELGSSSASYRNLSRLLPPFVDLSAEEDSFSSMESTLMVARDNIISSSQLPNLTGQQLDQALDAIRTASSLIWQMNTTVDKMLVSASEIDALTVNGQMIFADNDLIPLIESLRDLLFTLEREIEELVQEGIPWNAGQPFILLWVSPTQYYLEQVIRGGGYVYVNGTLASGQPVQIQMDGDNLTMSATGADGRYVFGYQIPLNASWLGTHSIRAVAETPPGILTSKTVVVSITLVPTFITLELNDTQFSYDGNIIASIGLRDVNDIGLGGALCDLVVDGLASTFETDSNGEYERQWSASEFSFGTHEISVHYEGVLPYASSSSRIAYFAVNIPTTIDLSLTATRVYIGSSIVGNVTLLANGTEALQDQTVTLYVDGRQVENVTTDTNGRFHFSLAASSMGSGSHTILASFQYRDEIWRYSQDEKGLTVYGQRKVAYPFFPFIPGWGGGPSETITDLFFGEHAYYVWLLILALVFIVVRVLQTRRREKSRKESSTVNLESIDKVIQSKQPSVPITAEVFASEIVREEGSPKNPNERVASYYRNLISFLARKRGVPVRASATHWELARLLWSLGYPRNATERATILFERALYSGRNLTDEDVVLMSSALGDIVSVRTGVIKPAG
jgi:hypothetical protein